MSPARVSEQGWFLASAPLTRFVRQPVTGAPGEFACSRRGQSVLKPTSRSVVRCQSWFYGDSWPRLFGLSRGPRASDWVPRHAAPRLIGGDQLEPECLQNPTNHRQEIPGEGTDSCERHSRCLLVSDICRSALLLPDQEVMAAILRARVRRAISGLIPLATRAWVKLLERTRLGSGRVAAL